MEIKRNLPAILHTGSNQQEIWKFVNDNSLRVDLSPEGLLIVDGSKEPLDTNKVLAVVNGEPKVYTNELLASEGLKYDNGALIPTTEEEEPLLKAERFTGTMESGATIVNDFPGIKSRIQDINSSKTVILEDGSEVGIGDYIITDGKTSWKVSEKEFITKYKNF